MDENFRLKDLLYIPAAILALLLFIPILTYIYFAQDLKSKEHIMNRNDKGVVLLDRFDEPFFTFYQGRYKETVPLSAISDVTKKAIITGEDKDFYRHPGFSLKAIAGAMYADIRHKGFNYGGSTITQQLVKNSLLNSRKSILRKYQEIILAQEIERRFTKDEILEMYLNSVYFGDGAFGVEEAAQTYFGIPASKLDLAQSAYLAAVLPAPSRYSPISGDAELAKERQKFILDNMVDNGYITRTEAEDAYRKNITFQKDTDQTNVNAPHFALMVRDELIKRFGEQVVARSGFTVRTTLDTKLQLEADKAVKNQVEVLKSQRVSNGAAVAIDPQNGEIRALVGSKDWNNEKFGKFNVVTSLRPPGSSFKPIVYAAALERGLITAASVLKDEPKTFAGGYKPKNYDGKFRGPVLVRRALANSLNVPAVEVMDKVGVENALQVARKFGIDDLSTDASQYGLSLVLGAGEVQLLDLTNAYAMFANDGKLNETTTISKITDKRGKVIYMHEPRPKEVLDPGFAFIISSILSDRQARQEAFGNALDIPKIAAVKTGTTEDYRDSLTIGYTKQIAVGVWVGNNDNAPMDNIAGSLGAAPIWKAIMIKALENTPSQAFDPPGSIEQVSICSSNGLRLREATSAAYKEYFYKGTEPTKYCYASRPSTPPQLIIISNQSPPPSQSPGQTPSPPPSTIAVPTPPDKPGGGIQIEIKEQKNKKDHD